MLKKQYKATDVCPSVLGLGMMRLPKAREGSEAVSYTHLAGRRSGAVSFRSGLRRGWDLHSCRKRFLPEWGGAALRSCIEERG